MHFYHKIQSKIILEKINKIFIKANFKKIVIITILLFSFILPSTQAISITIPADFQSQPKEQKIKILKTLIAQISARIQEILAEKVLAESDNLNRNTVFNNFSSINTMDFVFKLKSNPKTIVIDIRTDEEIKEGKIFQNALEIDFYKNNFNEELNKLDKSKIYFIYCRSGNRSDAAKKTMKNLGFKEVYDLNGGINKWQGNLWHTPNNLIDKNFLKGKKTLVVINSTDCPHCIDQQPSLKNIYKTYQNSLTFYINNQNYTIRKWNDGVLKEGYYKKLTYKNLTSKRCNLIPAWVLLAADGSVIKSSCGGNINYVKNFI